MRTRRSWRNQHRLYKQIGQELQRAAAASSARRIGQCDATDASGYPCVLVTAHATGHMRDRAGRWDAEKGSDDGQT